MTSRPDTDPSATAERHRDQFFAHLSQTIPGRKDFVVDSASGCTIRDSDGRSYLDLTAGIAVANIGHANPAVAAAVRAMAERMTHVNVYGRFVVPAQADLGREIARITPGALDVSFLVNSGAEGIEGALKLGRKYSGRPGIVAFEGAFHGRTMGALSVTWKERYRAPFEPLIPGVRFVPFGSVDAARAAIDESVGTVIVEPVQGEAGVRIPPPDFLPGLREACDRVGAVLIFDEVQGAFGRSGRWFSSEHWGVVPDVVVMAKAMGGGLPIGAFCSTAAIMDTFLDPPLSHLTTFGGNPVCCAAALAAIQYIRDHDLLARSERLGQHLADRLQHLVAADIGVVASRCLGLWAAIDLADDSLTNAVVGAAQERGVLVGSMLHSDATIRIMPPLTIEQSELDRGLDVLREAIVAVCRP